MGVFRSVTDRKTPQMTPISSAARRRMLLLYAYTPTYTVMMTRRTRALPLIDDE